MRKSAITLKEIKATKKLTLSQKAVLGEIHSLLARGKAFYAWNSFLAEKLGIGRSTAANALTRFYKNGILTSKCESKDGKTARITKRFLKINYTKLAQFLEIAPKQKNYERQPLHELANEIPMPIIQAHEDIDFTASEEAVFHQWSQYVIAVLDRKTGIINPRKREVNALRTILEDARRMINSSRNFETDSACSITQLMYDRRVENAIFYTLAQMLYDEKNIEYFGNEEWEVKSVKKADLNYAWMHNIYKPFPEVLAKAISKPADEGFNPQVNAKDDEMFHMYHYYSGVAYGDIPEKDEDESDEHYLLRVKELGFMPSFNNLCRNRQPFKAGDECMPGAKASSPELD